MSKTLKKIMVVTGGAGFIGSHLSDRLIKLGYHVRVLDNLSQGRREWIPCDAEFLEGDICEIDLCRKACDGAYGVFHLAAMSKVGPSIDKIEFCTQQNVIGTQNILIAARDAKVSKLVYSGSSTYYGNQLPPQVEDRLPECLNPYALSKFVGEQYCELFSRLYGLPTVTLRYFNVYGPRQPRTGAYALVMGIFLDQFKRGESLTIHGAGEQRRDFVHVYDVIEANIQAFSSTVNGCALNVGSGKNISVKELANLISSNQVHQSRRPGDAEITLADLNRMNKLLGWKARVSFEEGLAELMKL